MGCPLEKSHAEAEARRVRAQEHARNLATKLAAARSRIDIETEHRRGEAALHLFCQAYAEACGRGLERDSADLGDLLVRLETLVETRDPD